MNKSEVIFAPQIIHITLSEIAVGYLKIALSSFGGGLSSWAQLVIVEERKWLTDEEFLSALGLCRIMPGPTQVNLAVYVGACLRGFTGSLAALIGLIGVPFCLVLAAGATYFEYQYLPNVQSALRGAAAVAVGMNMGMGLKMLMRSSFSASTIFFVVGSFGAIGILRWPLIPVICILIPLSVWITWNWNSAFSGKEQRKHAQ